MIEKLTRLMEWAHSREAEYQPSSKHVLAQQSLWPWIEQTRAQSVLDCACGKRPGVLGQMLESHGVHSVGIDLLPGAEYQGDVHDLPFADASFDLVISREGPEHFLIPYLGIAEMIRVTRAWLILCLPADDPHCEDSPGHLYIMGRQGWENVFRKLALLMVEFSEFDVSESEHRPQREWRWLLNRHLK